MRNVKWTKTSEPVERSKDIPAAYHRLVCQLVAEIAHAGELSSHEAMRRSSYALEVLDAFAVELSSTRSLTPDFRSKVLTPILQRQLQGLHDGYSPSVSDGIAVWADSETGVVTIRDVTQFYLQEDPTLPERIPEYRRTMIYSPEMMWHLSVVLGKVQLGDETAYHKIRMHSDIALKAIKAKVDGPEDGYELVPRFTGAFSATEIAIIVEEELEEYFATELTSSVRTITALCQLMLTS